MLYLYLGTDRERARGEMQADIKEVSKNADVIRITDAHTIDDLRSALRGGGMFGGKQVLVFEGVCANPELCEVFLESLERLSKLDEGVFVFEEKPLADIRRQLEKHAEKVEKFDAPKKERDGSIFAIANALRRRDKKVLWVSYMREIAKGQAPEAIHGVLFWGAKDAFLKSNGKDEHAQRLIVELAELPHEARRRGEELEYALERFVLSGV